MSPRELWKIMSYLKKSDKVWIGSGVCEVLALASMILRTHIRKLGIVHVLVILALERQK